MAETKEAKVTDLVQDDKNFNRGTKEGQKLMDASLSRFGAGRSILIDKNNRIIAGNKTAQTYQGLGKDKIRIIETTGDELIAVKRTDVDLDSKEGREMALADNATGMVNLAWDEGMIDAVGEEFGFNPEDWGVNTSIGEAEPIENVEEDNYTDQEVDTANDISKEGDLWILGPHRLKNGSSTEPSDVSDLMGGREADCIIMDPPYNVNYQSKLNNQKIANDNLEDAAFFAFLRDAFQLGDDVLKAGGAFYIWHADSEGYNFRGACKAVGWKVRQTLIWNKNSLVLGRQDYQWKHEPCLYGWKDGAGHYFIDRRDQTTVIEDALELDLDKMKKEELRDLVKTILNTDIPTTIINENKPQRNAEHPTMKPLKLIGRQVKNSTRAGELVLDLFGGSGSTLIASEQLGRRCCIMELSEHYSSVIIDRYIKYKNSSEDVYLLKNGVQIPYEAVKEQRLNTGADE